MRVPSHGLLVVVLLLAAGCLQAAQPSTSGPPPAVGPGPAVPPGAYRFDASFAQVLEPGAYRPLPLAKSLLSSSLDGADIEVGVWRPDVPPDVRVPILVDAGPYYGNNGPPMENPGRHLRFLTSNFVPHGYAVAAVAVRGTGGSGGCMDLMGPSEVADLDQAITWLGTQAWSNGNVGMIGKSYDGSTPWMVASTGNSHLKTIVSVSGVPDLYGLMFRNGTSEIRGSFLLNALYYSFAVREQAPLPASADDLARAARHTAEGLACPDHARGLAAAAYSGTYGERDPAGYWAERDLKPRVEANYRGSILLVQGLQDWNVDPGLSIPWIDRLNRSGLFVHQVLGQWGHNYPDDGNEEPADPNMRWDWAEQLLRWFDHWLKGRADVDLGPAVQVLDQAGRWHTDDAFPARDTRWRTLHLSGGQALAPEPGAAGDALLLPQAAGDAVPSEALPGHAADFYLGELGGDLLVSGLPRVHVTVTPHGPTGHLAAWLYDEDENGERERIGWAMMNLLFADGGETAKPLTPGQPLVARMEIQPMDAVVPAGHRLLLRVWQYRDDPAPDTVQGRLPPLAPAPVTLHYGGDATSLLELPTIERGAEWYFEPPRPSP